MHRKQAPICLGQGERRGGWPGAAGNDCLMATGASFGVVPMLWKSMLCWPSNTTSVYLVSADPTRLWLFPYNVPVQWKERAPSKRGWRGPREQGAASALPLQAGPPGPLGKR